MSRRGWSPLKIGPPGPSVAEYMVPRTEYRSHTWSPPAADGPTPVMAFRASVETEKWARKDEADYTVSLSHRLGFRGEINNGTSSCMFGSKPWTPVTAPFSY